MGQLRPKVLVIGSLNIDYIAAVERLPAPGETIAATGLIQRFGGKGANQAVAAARQGASVSMIGCVGADDNGRAYRKRLRDEGVDVRGISISRRALTGTALIAVDAAAENIIIVAAGANGELKPQAIRSQTRLFRSAEAVLLQFEMPMPAAVEAVKAASHALVPVLLNPSPWCETFPWGQYWLDTLIANEIEAEAIFRLGADSKRHDWRRALRQKKIERLVITRGAKSTLCLGRDGFFEVPAIKVEPIDTVGAGDAFAGTFAARIAEGLPIEEAIRYANCAGALATLKPGAQESIPSRTATEKVLNRPHR
jgi:ribokinase